MSVCLAIPGRVVKILDDANRLALIDVAGVKRTVNVGLLDGEIAGSGVLAGEWVLIHAGFALSRIDEREALATLELLQQMGADYEQELRELRSSAIV
jgi:hydrogenase expression/formation protein HypC